MATGFQSRWSREQKRYRVRVSIVDWLQEFRENLVDERHPSEPRGNLSLDIETLPVLLRNYLWSREHKWHRVKNNICTHFPKDWNCDICLRTKMTRASCRRRTGTVVPKAEKFGDLITADHKVLSEGCESRNHHRHAIVVQDLATHWIQSSPYKTKTSQETQRKLQKFLEPGRKPEVMYSDNSLEFGKACEDFSWNHCTSTPHRSETNGTVERAVRRIKEGTSAVLLQSGMDEKWWSDAMECYCCLRNNQDLLSDGKTHHERRFGIPFDVNSTPHTSHFSRVSQHTF